MVLQRRTFLHAALSSGLMLPASSWQAWGLESPRKAPFRVLFSNDTTNIESSPSPFKKRGTPFTEENLRASVLETANHGIDVHLIQPGLCWIPWWQSTVMPMRQHVDWLTKQGLKPNTFERFVLNGGDIVKTFIEACRACQQKPFLSIRVNDAHHIFRGSKAKPEEREKAVTEFQLFADHPEWRLGPDLGPTMQYQFNWAIPAVRAYKLSLIRELCDSYDFDGIELDFMRHTVCFNPKTTPLEERRKIQADFVRAVRQALDHGGRKRWLCIRIPSDLTMHDSMGIHLPALALAGVDMVNASGYYFTDGQMPIAALRQQLPEPVALYSEVHFTTATTQRIPPDTGDQPYPAHRRTTPEQFYTVAHQTYEQGGDGISAYNFQYYRGTYNPTDVYGTPSEPPYEIFDHIGDPRWVKRQNQHYFIGMGRWGQVMRIKSQQTVEQHLFMAPPEKGWQQAGRLRIQSPHSLRDTQWHASLNGCALEPLQDVAAPYPSPYEVGIGKPEDYRAWHVPAALLRKGDNVLTLTLHSGPETKLTYLDLALPS